jgi:SAM-dependent methyltransferase
MLKKRSKEKELIDLGPDFYSQEEYEPFLKILFKINKLFGIFNDTVKLLKRFPKTETLVDIGCGGGLFLLNLNKYYPDMRMLGLDTSEDAIRVAQNELGLWKQRNININVEFQLQHQPELALNQDSVDIILLNLVCHHLDDEELIELLAKAHRAARKAVIINDVHRHSLSYYGYKFLSPLLFGNRLITDDGLISIEKGFTRVELDALLQQANLNNYQIKWHIPFRWSIVILKNKDCAPCSH